MCRYLQVFCMKYLHIPTAVCVTILLYFCKNTCIYCAGFRAGFRAGFCAVASPSARSHRRRIVAALHRSAKRRRLANFIRITYASGAADWLYTVWRSGASTSAGSGRSDDEDICWSHGLKVVTRWSSKSYAMHRPMRSKDLKHCTEQNKRQLNRRNGTGRTKPKYLEQRKGEWGHWRPQSVLLWIPVADSMTRGTSSGTTVWTSRQGRMNGFRDLRSPFEMHWKLYLGNNVEFKDPS